MEHRLESWFETQRKQSVIEKVVAFARAPVGEALPNYLVDTTKLHECIASASKRTKRRGGGVSKILFANCPAQTSLIGLASLQLQLNPVKIVCQIDLASILERGDGDAFIGAQKILSENLVKLKSDENEEDNTILLLLPKLETGARRRDSRKRRSRRRRRFDHFKAWDCVAQTVTIVAADVSRTFSSPRRCV